MFRIMLNIGKNYLRTNLCRWPIGLDTLKEMRGEDSKVEEAVVAY